MKTEPVEAQSRGDGGEEPKRSSLQYRNPDVTWLVGAIPQESGRAANDQSRERGTEKEPRPNEDDFGRIRLHSIHIGTNRVSAGSAGSNLRVVVAVGGDTEKSGANVERL